MGMKGHCLPRQWWQDGSEHVPLLAACGEVRHTRYRKVAIHIHRNPVDTVRVKAAFTAVFAFLTPLIPPQSPIDSSLGSIKMGWHPVESP